MKKTFRITVALTLLLLIGVMTGYAMNHFLHTDEATAQETRPMTYHSIEISEGDSLWSIAAANLPAGYDSTESYMEEIKQVNQLQSDDLRAGAYLLIPTYVE